MSYDLLLGSSEPHFPTVDNNHRTNFQLQSAEFQFHCNRTEQTETVHTTLHTPSRLFQHFQTFVAHTHTHTSHNKYPITFSFIKFVASTFAVSVAMFDRMLKASGSNRTHDQLIYEPNSFRFHYTIPNTIVNTKNILQLKMHRKTHKKFSLFG